MYGLTPKDASGNASQGEIIAERPAAGNYISASKTVALVGVHNLVNCRYS